MKIHFKIEFDLEVDPANYPADTKTPVQIAEFEANMLKSGDTYIEDVISYNLLSKVITVTGVE